MFAVPIISVMSATLAVYVLQDMLGTILYDWIFRLSLMSEVPIGLCPRGYVCIVCCVYMGMS